MGELAFLFVVMDFEPRALCLPCYAGTVTLVPLWQPQKVGLVHDSGHVLGRGRVSTQLIFSHLWHTDISYRFKQTKELGTGDKRYT
jgi:hypothetical protein